MRMTELSEVAELLRNGASIKQSDSAGGIPITRIETIANWNVNPDRCGYADVTEDDYPEYLMQDNDILISHINSTKHLGKCAIYRGNPEKLIHGMNLLGLRANNKVSSPDYIYRVLSSPVFRKQLPRITNNSVNQSSFTVKNFKTLQIPLPSLKEQKRIAAILDKADAIRRKRQQAIDLTDELLRSVFLDMFGDPGFNPNKYDELALGEIKKGKMSNGIFRKNNEYGGSMPVAWVGELFKGTQLDLSESRRVEPTEKDIKSYGLEYGDILFCRSSLKLEGIGWNNVYLGESKKALFECHLIKISLNSEMVNPVFLNYQLRLPNIRKRMFQQAKTVTMTTIDQDGLSNVRVMIPPIEEQNRFSDFFLALNERCQKKDDSLKYAENLFESLAQSAFRGELIKQTEAA